MEDYDRNVFINCPFDDQYFELLPSLVFTVISLGFNPCIALGTFGSSFLRLDRILELISKSKYSIHDLSRIQATAAGEYYRLNMPFELGLDHGCRHFNDRYGDKRSLVLATGQYDYMKAISDLNGLDIKHHEDNADKLISQVRSWFIEMGGVQDPPAPAKIAADYLAFTTQLFEAKLKKYTSSEKNDAEAYAASDIEAMPFAQLLAEIQAFIANRD